MMITTIFYCALCGLLVKRPNLKMAWEVVYK